MSKRFQINSEALLEAYAALNSTSGPIWPRFRPQKPSQEQIQNWSKIDLEKYSRPKPLPKAFVEAFDTSPSPFSKPPRNNFIILSSQTKKLSELLTSYCGRHHVDYRVGSHCHRCGSSLRSSFGMLALWQNIFESHISVLTIRNLFRQRFLFG